MSHPFNLKDPVHVLSVGFGSGLLKPAPGTWGTIAAMLIYFFALRHLPPMAFYALVAFTAVVGIYICGKPARDVNTQVAGDTHFPFPLRDGRLLQWQSSGRGHPLSLSALPFGDCASSAR